MPDVTLADALHADAAEVRGASLEQLHDRG